MTRSIGYDNGSQTMGGDLGAIGEGTVPPKLWGGDNPCIRPPDVLDVWSSLQCSVSGLSQGSSKKLGALDFDCLQFGRILGNFKVFFIKVTYLFLGGLNQ